MTQDIHPASLAQMRAADPSVNVWLVANAGSGKTKVLTDRVARLLLRGTEPQNILCLTYTKAAAAEMQNRLFRRLGEWAMAEDAGLIEHLEKLGEEGALSDAALRRARQLFARAIETPGGIRIQTIHSFCAGLLRRFPLEAGVSPAFSELDDRAAALLRHEILEEMADDHGRAAFEGILPEAGERVEKLLSEITGKRAEFAQMPDEAQLAASFGLPLGYSRAQLLDEALGVGDRATLDAVIPQLLASDKVSDHKAAAKLAGIDDLMSLAALQAMEGVFLYGSGQKAHQAKIDAFPTTACRKAMGPELDGLNALMARVEAARARRLALSGLEGARRLHAFAADFVGRYEARKAAQGWLDFDDFITRATALLTDPATAPWVLYRLDGSIDHVLVDEAQDTSPGQWRIIAALTEEFMAGEGAREDSRSLFVVGDKKQSIYSFQGADVAGFDAIKRRFGAGFDAAGLPLVELDLSYSFRSSRAILDLVDLSFGAEREDALGGAFGHKPFFDTLPGRADLWPVIEPPAEPEEHAWFDPVDLVGASDATEVLARQIAAEIATMLREGRQIPDPRAPNGWRAMHAGDVLILVQRRGPIFNAIIRACKAAGLPIAGPDRLTLTGELAVRDLIALLSFLNTPEDDLALATALRSPLFGWSEADLYHLAQPRKGYLWEELRKSEGHEATRAVLDDLRKLAEFLRPYDLLDRVLTRHQGRAKLLGRLGEEAADAIDELSQQALAYERGEVPSLTGFLVWMEAGEVEVKRQAEGEGRLIRVMTVHGSKGLEAPIVILPDTGDRRLSDKDMVVPVAEGVMGWSGRAGESAEAVADTKLGRADAREAENLRLLYVAMTRAKHWLITAAAGKAGDASWYGIIKAGLERLDPVEIEDGRLRHSFGAWAPDQPAPAVAYEPPVAPQYAGEAAPAMTLPPRLFSPSGLGGGAAVVGAGAGLRIVADFEEDDALERGTVLHLLLQHLAGVDPALWPRLAARLGASEAVYKEAETLLRAPDLAAVFAENSLAEAEVAGPWAGARLAGAIDRLCIGPDKITIVDFKSNRVVPRSSEDIPEAYLRQLGAYAHIVTRLYPDHAIETAILWTRAAVLMPVEGAVVAQALARAAVELGLSAAGGG